MIQAGLEALQREHDLATQRDDELERGFADFEAGRFKRFDSVSDLRTEIESRLEARAAASKQ